MASKLVTRWLMATAVVLGVVLGPAQRMSAASDLDVVVVCNGTTLSPSQPYKLHAAAYLGCLDMVKKLIDGGANINEKDKNDNTPLEVASATGHLDVVDFLIANGADLKRSSGALILAAENGKFDVTKYFLDKKLYDVNYRNSYGFTALDLARKYKETKIINLLVAKGAKP